MDLNKITIRGLTRGQLRELRKQGITAQSIAKMEEDQREDALDKIFKMACPDFNADDLLPMEGMDLYNRIMDLTYVTEKDKKKSESPQSSAAEEDSTIVANAERQDSENNDTAQKSEETDGSSPKNPFSKLMGSQSIDAQ